MPNIVEIRRQYEETKSSLGQLMNSTVISQSISKRRQAGFLLYDLYSLRCDWFYARILEINPNFGLEPRGKFHQKNLKDKLEYLSLILPVDPLFLFGKIYDDIRNKISHNELVAPSLPALQQHYRKFQQFDSKLNDFKEGLLQLQRGFLVSNLNNEIDALLSGRSQLNIPASSIDQSSDVLARDLANRRSKLNIELENLKSKLTALEPFLNDSRIANVILNYRRDFAQFIIKNYDTCPNCRHHVEMINEHKNVGGGTEEHPEPHAISYLSMLKCPSCGWEDILEHETIEI